jgi:hypothetical protein
MRDLDQQADQWNPETPNPASRKEKAEGSVENVGGGTHRIPEEISHTGQGADNRSRGSDSSIAEEQQSRQGSTGTSGREKEER